MFIRKSAEAFIYSVFFLSCATLNLSAMLIKCSKKLYFSKKRRGAFLSFDAKAIRGDALSIKCDRILCFSKERQGAYFCPTYIEGGFLSRIYGLNSICRFFLRSICITFVLNFYYICAGYYVNFYICGFKVKTNVNFTLVRNSCHYVPRST